MDRPTRNLRGEAHVSIDNTSETRHPTGSYADSTTADSSSGELKQDMEEIGLAPRLPAEPCFASKPPTLYRIMMGLKSVLAGIAAAAALLKAEGLLGVRSSLAPVAGRTAIQPGPAHTPPLPESTVPLQPE